MLWLYRCVVNSTIIYIYITIIIIIIHRLNARRRPMSHLFLTRWVSQLLGLALVSWAFARIGVHRPSLRLKYLVFSIRPYLPLDFNCVSFLRPMYRHPPHVLPYHGEILCLTERRIYAQMLYFWTNPYIRDAQIAARIRPPNVLYPGLAAT